MSQSSDPKGAGGQAPDASTYRSNPEIDAKIDTYIRENPRYWAYIQGMTRDRLERTLVLNEVQKLERQERVREGLLNQIHKNPELKQAYDTLVKNVPEDQRENAMLQIARQARNTLNRSKPVGVKHEV